MTEERVCARGVNVGWVGGELAQFFLYFCFIFTLSSFTIKMKVYDNEFVVN